MSYFVYYENEKITAISDHAFKGERKFLKAESMPSGSLSLYLIRKGRLMKRDQIPWQDMRVAVISDWGINCGIATYTKYLCNQLRPLVADLRIFAEDANPEFCENDETDKVTRCWNRAGDYSSIREHIEKFNPDVIFLQHEFGLFHKANLFCSLMSQLSRWRTIVTLHTVLDHDVESDEARLDYMTRSLSEAACREVIVHTPRARLTLRDRGFSGHIHFIPHGCHSPSQLKRLPATKYGMFPKHSLFQYGFGGAHKGWESAIAVVEQLAVKYPDIFYIGVFNVSSDTDDRSNAYHEKLLKIVRDKGLEKNIAILKGYQSETMLSNFLRSVKACLFLYQVPNNNWASWGASGAIQQPLSLGVPMVLSRFPAFQEMEGKLPLCGSVEEAIDLIDRIFSDETFEEEMFKRSHALAQDRSWERVASWYLECSPGEDFNAKCL